MILSVDEVLKRKILSNRDFAEGDGLVDPEGAALDVRVGEIWRMITESEAFLRKVTRKTRQYYKIANYVKGEENKFIIEPNVFYQFRTIESLNMPDNIVAKFNPRYNLLVNGIFIHPAKADPGYKGTIGVPVFNLSGVALEIELGARFGQFEFHQVKGKTYLYRGQWKGGRLFTQQAETQV